MKDLAVFASSNQPIRVLLVDDDDAFAELMTFVLRNDAAAEVVGHAADGAEGVRLAGELRPDVVVMDLRMPRMDGFAATQQIVKRVRGARVIAVSSSTDPDDVERVLEAGAAGFVPKERVVTELPDAVGRLRRARRYLGRAWQIPLLRPTQSA